MEKVNAMKKIALFMMIVGLAVALVACQGAVGPKGPAGPTGPSGPSGPSGTIPIADQPVDAFVALAPVKLAELGLSPILINDGPPVAGTTTGQLGTVPTGLSVADYFRGGYLPIVYSRATVPTAVPATDAFTVAIAADGAITITAKKDTVDDTKLLANTLTAREALYTDGTTFAIVATDETGKALTIGLDANSDGTIDPGDSPYVAVKMNRAPRKGQDAIAAITVGTQPGFAVKATPAQKKDMCYQFNIHCPVDGNDMPQNIIPGSMDASTNFYDEDFAYLTFDADPAPADAAYVDAEVTAKANAGGTKDYRLRITGLAGGGTAAAPKRKAAVVNLTATDLGGLTTPLAQTMAIVVNVDPMPALSADRTLPTAVTKKTAAMVTVVEALSLFFMDDSTLDDTATTGNANADARTLTITADVAKASDDPNGVIGTLAANASLVNAAGNLEIEPKNTGTVTITIRATESGTDSIGQYVERTIKVTITE